MISFFGTWVERIGLGWLAWELTHSTFWTGFVAVSGLAPIAIMGPLIGIFAEKWDKRKATILFNSIMSLVSLALSILYYSGYAKIEIVIIFALVLGCLMACSHPVRLTLVTEIVPKKYLSSAIGLGAASFNVSRILGPALAAILINNIGIGGLFFVNALSYIPLIILMSIIPLLPLNHERKVERGVYRQLVSGMKYVTGQKIILWCLVVSLINSAVIRGVLEMLPGIVGSVLAGDASTLAAITSSAGAGALCGSLFVSWIASGQRRVIQLLMLVLPIGTFGIILAGLFPAFNSLIVIITFVAFCSTCLGIGAQTLIQLNVDDQFRARTLTWWSTISFGGASMGGLLLGALGEFMPIYYAMLGTGAFGVLVSIPVIRAALSIDIK